MAVRHVRLSLSIVLVAHVYSAMWVLALEYRFIVSEEGYIVSPQVFVLDRVYRLVTSSLLPLYKTKLISADQTPIRNLVLSVGTLPPTLTLSLGYTAYGIGPLLFPPHW